MYMYRFCLYLVVCVNFFSLDAGNAQDFKGNVLG